MHSSTAGNRELSDPETGQHERREEYFSGKNIDL
jgi:hypothetical protein